VATSVRRGPPPAQDHYASRADVPDIDMKYQVIQRQRTINGHRGPILEIELFTDEPAARDRAGVLRDSNHEHIVSLRRVGCVIPDTAEVKRCKTPDW
jgi:hypothetical protein